MEILSDGDRRRLAVEKVRADRTKALEEIEAVGEALLSLDETVQRVIARLHDDADRAQANILSFARPSTTPDAPAINAGFLLWLCGPDFEKQLRARLKPHLPSGSISQVDRQRQLAALRTRLVELEEAEEREICRLEAAGLAIDRREDADLEAILRVWSTLEELAA